MFRRGVSHSSVGPRTAARLMAPRRLAAFLAA